jgi:outer membrane protein insertion porin family
MRVPTLALAALFIALTALPSPSQSVDSAPSWLQFIGKPIAAVRLVIDGRELMDAEAARAVETAVGGTLTTPAVRESIVRLMAMARFEDVTVEAEVSPSGVVLTYVLAPTHPVKVIRFQGDLGLPERQLRAAVTERYSASPPLSRIEEIADMLEGLCRDHGYMKAAVRPVTAVIHKPDQTTLTFEMAAGPQALVLSAEIEGAPDGNAAAVRSKLGIQPGARFDRVSLESAVGRYVTELRADGFLEAKVGTDLKYSDNREQVDVTVRLTLGPRVTVAFRGDPLPDKRRAEIVALLQEAALDQDVLENQERSIEDELRGRGYRDATAPFTRETVREGVSQVVFTVTRGPQYRVAGVDVVGQEQLPRARIQPVLRVQAGHWFVKARMEADATAVRELYRQEGFRAAEVKADTEPVGGDPTQLLVKLSIAEGPRTVIGEIAFEHVSAMPIAKLQAAITARVDAPYFQPRIETDREAVEYQYQLLGYQQATVTIPPEFSQDETRFTLRFVVNEGQQSLIDHVLIVGNVRTKVATIEREVGLKPGMPLSFLTLNEAQRRLSALGLFRKIQVTQVTRSTSSRHDVLVLVEEAPVHSIGYGGGVEGAYVLKTNAATGVPEQKFDVAPRGFFEIGRRNLWGKNRSVNVFVRGALRTSGTFNTGQEPTTPQPEDTSTSEFYEYRVLVTYREPLFLGLPFDFTATVNADQAIRSTFDFNRKQVFAEGSRRFLSSLAVAGRYSLSENRIFNARIDPASALDVDKLFPQVRLSAFSGSVVRNTRDDAFDPTHGTLLSFDATLAARAIGSEVGFTKGFWQAFVYQRVPKLGGAVVAAGARVGLANGFRQEVVEPDGSVTVIDQELPASERFFAGGDTSVRGFALDQLGSASVLDQNGVSNGGNGLVIFNAELRIPIWRKKSLGGVVFVDTGNVFATTSDIDLAQLRTAVGFGARWKSPIGPLRLDFAWKLHPITFGNGSRESGFAWYVTIGQAF